MALNGGMALILRYFTELVVSGHIAYKNSSGDEIANVNFFNDDIAHT